MSGYIFAIVLSAAVVIFLVTLLRRRRIREKYAAIWIALGVAVLVLATFPQLAFWFARLVGVETPVNLLFAGGFVILLGVCIQLSSSVTSLEERTRTLTEEIALLSLDVRTSRTAREAATSADAVAEAADRAAEVSETRPDPEDELHVQ